MKTGWATSTTGAVLTTGWATSTTGAALKTGVTGATGATGSTKPSWSRSSENPSRSIGARPRGVWTKLPTNGVKGPLCGAARDTERSAARTI